MEIKDFNAGQTVYILSEEKRNNPPCGYKEAKVKKVGRVYITLEGNWERKFFIPFYGNYGGSFLVEKKDYGADNLLFKSKQDLDDYIEKRKLESELCDALNWQNIRTFTLEQLRAIKRIIQEDE
ncbi:MAG: hypothetical protein J6Y20_00955 [Lachnospiraceae bacterium]|nr:hypothetical protein [Lachnospiraceae bacterium]